MRIEDQVQDAGNGEVCLIGPQSSVLSVAVVAPATGTARPAPCECDPVSLQRVRWRCRRGLLELDIVLGRFVAASYAGLSAAERQIFEQFLDMPDNPLWDMISGKQDAVSGEHTALLEKIKSV